MKNIFLAPRSGEQSSGNFQKTIQNGYKKQDLLPYLEDSDRKALAEKNIVFIWGNRPGGKAPWEKMQKSDYVFFYQHGKITWIGQLMYKTHNKKLADALWGPYISKGVKEYWEYVYFLENLVNVKIDYSILRELAGYKPNAIVQGFQSYRENGIKAILDKYGSIENFMNMYRVDKQSVNDMGKEPSDKDGELSEISLKIKKIHQYILATGFKYFEKDIANFYLSLRSKPFVILAGISGTGKTQLVRKFAEAIKAKCELIPVKPDWTDNSDLIGYFDLNNKFKEKKIVEVIRRALDNPDKIYFVLLDEMNLARVEHYFSDFLSIIETRKFEKTDIVTEPIIKDADTYGNHELSHLYIPSNIYIVGTVNMDETTHPFSRRVLDRANSIELSEIDLNWEESFSGESTPIEGINNDFLKAKYINSNDLTNNDRIVLNDVLQKLEEINDILKFADLQIGYRVRNEMSFYMLYQKEISNILSFDDALDYQIMQKILPRIQGSSTRIRILLVKLLQNLSNKTDFDENYPTNKIYESVKNVGKYKKSINKILFMLRRYDDDGFTSFWL